MKFAKLFALLPLVFALTDCNRIEALFKPKKPSPYAFDLILKMSPRAEAALKRPDAGLVVYASYYGDAAPAYRARADKLNRIYLGEEYWTYSGHARRVHLHGEPIDTARLSQTRDGQPQALVSVTLAQGDPDDMMACHDYIGPIRLAQQQIPVLDCEFESERYWENVPAGPGRAPGQD